MDVRVLGWRYENIRGGLRDIDVDLGSPPPRWTLIQMPNGTGKTTTMALFRALFSGAALAPDVVRDFRASDSAPTGLFEVRLSLDGRLYRLQLRLDFRSGTSSYWTIRSEVRGGGLEEGLALPSDLHLLLTPQFVRLFVFDGELAKEIRSVGKERAAEAIKTLYRLDRLAALRVSMSRLVREQQARAAATSTATEAKGLHRWQNRLEAALERQTNIEQTLKDLRRRQREADARFKALEAQISEHIQQDATLRARKQVLDDERITVDRALGSALTAAVDTLRLPAKLHPRIADRLHTLGTTLTVLKLPKTTSSEFFEELAEQPQCVCGRPIGDAEKAAIRERKRQYLADDEITVINRMKAALRESAGDPRAFPAAIANLNDAVRRSRENKTALDRLELERIASGDSEVEELREERGRLENELGALAEDEERITTRDSVRQRAIGSDETNNVHLCKAEIALCEEKVSTITHTRRFMKQAEYVSRLVEQVEAVALERMRERVRQSTNEKLQRLSPSEALRVSRIGGAIELTGGEISAKSGVSEGQSLAVAYAFLTSLLSDAPYKLPFIVDSPAVSLDTRVRREVGELIPELFRQMIMFVISSEREGFADAFYPRSDVRYITVWREGDRTESRTGLATFKQFHVTEVT